MIIIISMIDVNMMLCLRTVAMTIDRVSLVSALERNVTWLFRLLSLMGIGLCLFFWLTLFH